MKNSLDLWRGQFPRSLFDLVTEFDSVLDKAWRESSVTPAVERGFRPSADVRETEKAYLMSFDLPGVKQEDIKIDLSNDTLTVTGVRKSEVDETTEHLHRTERYYGKFERSFNFSKPVSMDHVEANFENGVLQVVVPKTETSRVRAVEVQSGKGKGFFSKFLGTREEVEKDSKH